MRVLLGLALGVAGLLALAVAPVAAAEPDFGEATIEASMSGGIVVTQPVTIDELPAHIELLITFANGDAPQVIESHRTSGEMTLQYTVPADAHILPNTPAEARYRITDADGTIHLGPTVSDVYDDDRVPWKTLRGDVVRVHWYEGDEAFGARALAIGEQAVAETAALLGVTEEEPVDFFIYADQAAFYDALGPGTRENVGGQANAEIRTLFALIGPNDLDDPWVEIVVPHELVHLVFDTAVSNPYHFPPRWLNEGLAVYLSQGYDASDRRAVESAAADGTLIPLDGLAGQFPTSASRFFQAYAESVSAVDFLIRTHGQDALIELITSYADGRTDDEAFLAAIGMDVAAFDAAWMADLDAEIPVRHGPQPAPAGPVPAAWATAEPGGGPSTAPSDAAPTTAVEESPVPGAAPVAPSDGPSALLVAAAIAAVLAITGLAVGLTLRRRGAARVGA